MLANPKPTPFTACPDCGGVTEPGDEHGKTYDRVCRPCRKVFIFAALDVYGFAANTLVSTRPLAGPPATEPGPVPAA